MDKTLLALTISILIAASILQNRPLYLTAFVLYMTAIVLLIGKLNHGNKL